MHRFWRIKLATWRQSMFNQEWWWKRLNFKFWREKKLDGEKRPDKSAFVRFKMCVRRFDRSDHSVCIIIAQPVVPYAFQWAIFFHLPLSRSLALSVCLCVRFVNALFAAHRSKPFKILRRIRKSFKEKQDTIATAAVVAAAAAAKKESIKFDYRSKI